MRTLGQKRAEYALEIVLAARGVEKFDSLAAGAPSMILQNGFGQTMAFWASKGGEEPSKLKYFKLFDAVKNWLSLNRGDIQNNFIKPTNSREDFLLALSSLDQTEYLAAQNEALKLLEWIKRYANAFC